MDRTWKSVCKYLLLFFFCFFILVFTYSIITSDAIWNYGFSYAIARGEVPYVDFNMVVPPFSPIFYLIPFLFSNSYLVYLLFQSVLFVILFYFLEKLFTNKIYLLLLFFMIPFPVGNVMLIYPGYNFLLLLLFVLILYCEKKKVPDFWVGILLGLCIFTKQSVGIFLLLPSFYYLFQDKKRFFKRCLGIGLVCLFFLGYFLVSGNLWEFFNHCFLGLIDFSNSNRGDIISNIYFWLWLIPVGCLICFLIKKNHKLFTAYLLCFSTIALPIFDHYHTNLFLFVFLFFIISRIPWKSKWFMPWCFLMSVLFYLLSMGVVQHFRIPHIAHFNNFEIFKMSDIREEEIYSLNRYLKTYDSSSIIFLTGDAYFFKIINDMDVNSYDLLNYGNHGYHGTEKILRKLKKEKNKIIILNSSEYKSLDSTGQLNMKVIQYVLDYYNLERRVGDYEIYQKVS